MTDPSHPYETSDDGGMPHDDEASGGIPRWVRVVGIIVVIVALLVIAVLLVGGGHRPRPHGLAGGQAPPAGVPAAHAPPHGDLGQLG